MPSRRGAGAQRCESARILGRPLYRGERCEGPGRHVGSGPLTLVFAADPPNVLEHHDEAFAALAEHVRVVGVELPGFGFSTAPTGHVFSLEENRDALLASSGARAWADRVDNRRVLRARSWASWSPDGRADASPKGGTTSPQKIRDGRDFARPALSSFDDGASYPLASALQSLTHADPDHLFATLNGLPAPAVWGRRERTHRRADPAALARYLPRLQTVEIEVAGHFPELEAEGRFKEESFSGWRRAGSVDVLAAARSEPVAWH